MPIWVNGRCVIRSPIAEPGGLSNAIKIKALSREPGNPGWTVSPVHHKLRFMGDLDDTQFQPILQDIADDTVVPLVLIIKQIYKSNKVRKTNNRPSKKKEREELQETY